MEALEDVGVDTGGVVVEGSALVKLELEGTLDDEDDALQKELDVAVVEGAKYWCKSYV